MPSSCCRGRTRASPPVAARAGRSTGIRGRGTACVGSPMGNPGAKAGRLFLPAVWISVLGWLLAFAPHRDKLLDAAATDRLAGVQVPLRVQGDRVQERELACLMARTSESADARAQGAIEAVENLISAIGFVEAPLARGARTIEVPPR